MKIHDMKPIAGLFVEAIEQLKNIFPEHDYKCPYCGYEMLDGEEEDCGDCGCPSCRHIIDWEDFN